MPVIQTKVDRSSEEFEKNKEAHEALAENLREVNDYVMQGGPERSREKHLERGKLLARDRVAGLLDEGSHISSRSAGRQHGRSTAMTCPAQGSSPASVVFTASNA